MTAAFCPSLPFEHTNFVLATSYCLAMYRTRFFTSEQYPLLSFRLDSYFLREIVICIRLSPPVQSPSLSPIHSTILLAYTSPKTYLRAFQHPCAAFPPSSSVLRQILPIPVHALVGLPAPWFPDLWQLPSTPLPVKQFHTDVCEHYLHWIAVAARVFPIFAPTQTQTTPTA